MRTTQEIVATLEAESPFPDSPCVCNAGENGCACPKSERALRNISARTWPHGLMTEDQRRWCIREADQAGEGTYKPADLEMETDRDLAQDVLQAWSDYARSQGLL